MKIISVVVPVYNGEQYIRKCLDSILSQKNIELESIEVLLVNDGSTDASLDILHEYYYRYPNIFMLVDQQNKGAAYSRNRGIKLARGEFVMLVDQDDWIDDDFCSRVLNEITSSRLDVVQVGFKLVDATEAVVKETMPVPTGFGRLLAIPAWAKLYRTDFLRNNNITFFENNIGEDNIFTLKVAILAKKYKSISYAGYNNFYENEQNVTNTLHKGLSEKVNIIALLDEMATIKGRDTSQQMLLDYNKIRTGVYYLLSYGRYAAPKRFIEVNRQLFAWFGRNINSYKRNRYVWRKPAGEHVSASLGIKTIIVINSLHMVKLFAFVYTKIGK